MRNYLLAGTSAFALAFSAGAVKADTDPGKFDVKISGDAYFESGSVIQDKNAGTTSTDFANRFRLVVNPVATADNGLTYGAKVRIRANAGNGLVDGDRAYIYVGGTFGEVRGGVDAGPSDNTFVGNPMDWQMLGLYDQWRQYLPNSNGSTNGGTTGNYSWGWWHSGGVAYEGMQLLDSHYYSTKLEYYSPRFFGQTSTSGLQGAVSYTPENGSFNTDVARSTTGTDATATPTFFSDNFRDLYELTLNYNENFNGLTVKASGGFEGGSVNSFSVAATSTTKASTSTYNSLESGQIGLQLAYADFAIGGGFVWGTDSGFNTKYNSYNPDQTAWNVGGQYTYGPYVVGVKYLEEDLSSTLGNDNLGAVTAGVMYTVAPGLRTGVEYTHFDSSVATALQTKVLGTTTAVPDSGDVFLVRGYVTW